MTVTEDDSEGGRQQDDSDGEYSEDNSERGQQPDDSDGG